MNLITDAHGVGATRMDVRAKTMVVMVTTMWWRLWCCITVRVATNVAISSGGCMDDNVSLSDGYTITTPMLDDRQGDRTSTTMSNNMRLVGASCRRASAWGRAHHDIESSIAISLYVGVWEGAVHDGTTAYWRSWAPLDGAWRCEPLWTTMTTQPRLLHEFLLTWIQGRSWGRGWPWSPHVIWGEGW